MSATGLECTDAIAMLAMVGFQGPREQAACVGCSINEGEALTEPGCELSQLISARAAGSRRARIAPTPPSGEHSALYVLGSLSRVIWCAPIGCRPLPAAVRYVLSRAANYGSKAGLAVASRAMISD